MNSTVFCFLVLLTVSFLVSYLINIFSPFISKHHNGMNLRPYDEPIYTRVRKDHELIDARLFSRCIDERRVKTVAVRILEVPAELCGVILVN